MVEFCGQLPGVVASLNVSVGVGSQASVAVAVAKLGVAGHSIVLGAGRLEIVGAFVSAMWITWLAVLVLPQWSTAVHVRVMVEFCGQLPGVVASANVSVGVGSQASIAVGVAKLGVAGHSIVLGSGSAEMAGAFVSVMWMICFAVLELPQWSIAVHVRQMLEFCGQLPGVVTSLNDSVGAGSQ